jgi:hypothetical protein
MLHLVALSFEHRVGNQIDVVFPPFPDEPHISDWNQGLPFIAIPDKAHDAVSCTIQFTLPQPNERNHCVYGLAAFRAIATSELNQNDQYIRGHVQKALCVISRVPLFGELEQRLKSALYDNFDHLTSEIENLFTLFCGYCEEQTVPFSGISYASLFQSLQLNVLTLVKSIMAGHSILIFAENSELVSKMVCAIASLLPGFIYDCGYPFTFLESDAYSFSPYVPLQFADTLNSAKSKGKLLGTCSELFMVQKIVDYEILVDCRKLPATVTGDLLADFKLREVELNFMRDLLAYLKENWATEEAPEYIRNEFRKYIDSVFTSFFRVRHIGKTSSFAWQWLDWKRATDAFGKRFVKEVLANKAVVRILLHTPRDVFEPIDERFLVKRKSSPARTGTPAAGGP